MNWIPDDAAFRSHDWNAFEYEEDQAIAVRKLRKDEVHFSHICNTHPLLTLYPKVPVASILYSDSDWEDWFSNVSS